MLRIKLIDRYILRKFISVWCLSIVMFLSIFHIVDVIEKIDKFLKYNLSLKQVLTIYYYQLPWFIDMTIPMSVLLASVFTIGNLAKHNELTAIKSSSISMYRLSAPIIITGIIICVSTFFFEDMVMIPANVVKFDLENEWMRKHRKYNKSVFDNITFQESKDCNIVIKRFYLNENMGRTITIQRNHKNSLEQRIDAKKMIWLDEQKKWELRYLVIRRFDEQSNEIASEMISDTLLYLDFEPSDISMLNRKPEEMQYGELKKFIGRMKASGNDTKKLEVNLYFKTAFPMTCLIVILIGFPITAFKTRKNTSFGAGVSLVIIFFYYGFIKFGQVLGFNGSLPPLYAAWLGNFVFMTLGSLLFYNIKQ